MLTKEQFSEICSFTQRHLEETFIKDSQGWAKSFPRAAEYRWQHTLNVLQNAEKILAGEKLGAAVADIVKVSAVMHDVSMFVCDHSIHGQVSAEITQKYLSAQGFSDIFTNRVARAIAEHGVDFDDLSPDEMGVRFSLEGKILIEADILDKFGVSALTNALLGLGKDGLLPFECRTALKDGREMQRALYFKDYLWTETGKKMRDDRLGFFLSFLDQMSEEVVEKNAP
jgi:HD superfamily phosphodiesterase